MVTSKIINHDFVTAFAVIFDCVFQQIFLFNCALMYLDYYLAGGNRVVVQNALKYFSMRVSPLPAVADAH